MLKMITNEVPVGLENYYTATENGQFKLNVEDAVHASEVEALKNKNKEFRDNNVNLIKENEKFKGFSTLVGSDNLSPDKFQERIDSLANERLSKMTEQMKSSYETKIKELGEVAAKHSTKLSELVLGNAVTKAAADHGVISTAFDDVASRAKDAFDVVDGELKFRENKLDAEGKPYTLASWMQETRVKAPHLFAPSQGTGAARPSNVKGKSINTDTRSAVEKMSAGLSQQSESAIKRLI